MIKIINYLICKTSERITIARSTFSVGSVIRQISVKSVIASFTFRAGVSGPTLAAELTPEID